MVTYYADEQVTLHHGDSLEVASGMEDGSADCIVTSPPYFGLRDYGTEGQYGLEASPAAYVETMRALFAELRRVLADDGTLWLNIGDSYVAGGSMTGTKSMRQRLNDSHLRNDTIKRGFGLPAKNLLGIPWRVAFALQDDGWILRNAIIWNKPNAMPESVTDRLSGRYEHVFLFSKSRKYWFDLDPIREPLANGNAQRTTVGYDTTERYGAKNGGNSGLDGLAARMRAGSHTARNPGDVWTIPTAPFSAAHFAVFPIALPQRCILAGCKPGGTVLDPFSGSGTTGLAAQRLGRKYVGIDLNAEYLDLSLKTRLAAQALDFGEGA